MTILDLFLSFCDKILNYKIFNITLLSYLITFTILIFVFKLISIIGNNKK